MVAATMMWLVILACSASASGSIAFERDDEVWVAGDDGSQELRVASGREPHLTPDGATVLYRSPGGSRLYSVPATGGTRTLLHTIRVPRHLGLALHIFTLRLQFAAHGQKVLIPVLNRATLLADPATGAVQRLPVPGGAGTLSPDGGRVAWIRAGRSCRLVVREIASGHVRSLSRVSCRTQVAWGSRGIAVASGTRRATHVSVVDPATAITRHLLSTSRVIDLVGASKSGAWRMIAFAGGHHQMAALLVLPDGRRSIRPLGRDSIDAVFTADDTAVLVTGSSGAIVRIDLATGQRRRVGATDGFLATN